MSRASFLTTYDLHRLDLAVRPLRRAFHHAPYLVGSAGERGDYRDVDVRLILPDEEFDALFPIERAGLWGLICFAVTAWLRADTGLPIDFQIQRMTEANEKYGDKPRNALGGRDPIDYAGMGDATGYRKAPPTSPRTSAAGEET